MDVASVSSYRKVIRRRAPPRKFESSQNFAMKMLRHKNSEDRRYSIVPNTKNDPTFMMAQHLDQSLEKLNDKSHDSLDDELSDREISSVSNSIAQGPPGMRPSLQAKSNLSSKEMGSHFNFPLFSKKVKIEAKQPERGLMGSATQINPSPETTKKKRIRGLEQLQNFSHQITKHSKISLKSQIPTMNQEALSPGRHQQQRRSRKSGKEQEAIKEEILMHPADESQAFNEHSAMDMISLEISDDQTSLDQSQVLDSRKTKQRRCAKMQTLMEKWHSEYSIQPAGAAFQIWKVIVIVVSFSSSFFYAHEAAFLHKQSSEQIEIVEIVDMILTMFFALDFLIGILTNESATKEDEKKWTIEVGLRRILSGKFLIDLIAIIPFYDLMPLALNPKDRQYFFFLKVVRLYNGYQFLDYRTYKKQILQIQMNRMAVLIKKRETGEDQDRDNAKMSQIMLAIQILRTFRSVINLSCLSYFFGMFWYVFCEAIFDARLVESDKEETFFYQYDLENQTDGHTELSMMYFSFTTLSTVGLGDFHPKNSSERVVCSFVMLFGVMVTSMAMDSFSNMIKELRNFNKPYDDASSLAMFLGTLKKYNEGDIDKGFAEKLHTYFEYRWQHDRNLAIYTDADNDLLDQLPGRVQTQIYVTYLFKEFVTQFSRLLELGQEKFELKRMGLMNLNRRVHLSHDQQLNLLDSTKYYSTYLHDQFIVQFLTLLEPIFTYDQQVILRQMSSKDDENVTEMYFLQKGEIEVGYSHALYLVNSNFDELAQSGNKKNPNEFQALKRQVTAKMFLMRRSFVAEDVEDIQPQQPATKKQRKDFRYPLTRKAGQPVGVFEILFDSPAQYQYKFKFSEDLPEGENRCYFIRRNKFKAMLLELGEDPDFGVMVDKLQDNVLTNYVRKIHVPMQKAKRENLREECAKLVGGIDDQKIAKEKSILLMSLFIKNNTMKSQKSNITSRHNRKYSVSDDASLFTEYLPAPPIKETDIVLEEDPNRFETRDDIAAFILGDGDNDVVIRGLRDIKIQEEEEDEGPSLDDVEENWTELHKFSTRLIASVTMALRQILFLQEEVKHLRSERDKQFRKQKMYHEKLMDCQAENKQLQDENQYLKEKLRFVSHKQASGESNELPILGNKNVSFMDMNFGGQPYSGNKSSGSSIKEPRARPTANFAPGDYSRPPSEAVVRKKKENDLDTPQFSMYGSSYNELHDKIEESVEIANEEDEKGQRRMSRIMQFQSGSHVNRKHLANIPSSQFSQFAKTTDQMDDESDFSERPSPRRMVKPPVVDQKDREDLLDGASDKITIHDDSTIDGNLRTSFDDDKSDAYSRRSNYNYRINAPKSHFSHQKDAVSENKMPRLENKLLASSSSSSSLTQPPILDDQSEKPKVLYDEQECNSFPTIPLPKSPGYPHRANNSNSSLVQFEKKETMMTKSSVPMDQTMGSGFADTPNWDRQQQQPVALPLMNIQFPMDYNGVYTSLVPEAQTNPSATASPELTHAGVASKEKEVKFTQTSQSQQSMSSDRRKVTLSQLQIHLKKVQKKESIAKKERRQNLDTGSNYIDSIHYVEEAKDSDGSNRKRALEFSDKESIQRFDIHQSKLKVAPKQLVQGVLKPQSNELGEEFKFDFDSGKKTKVHEASKFKHQASLAVRLKGQKVQVEGKGIITQSTFYGSKKHTYKTIDEPDDISEHIDDEEIMRTKMEKTQSAIEEEKELEMDMQPDTLAAELMRFNTNQSRKRE